MKCTFLLFAPSGAFENSPVIHHRGCDGTQPLSPRGTTEPEHQARFSGHSAVPPGLNAPCAPCPGDQSNVSHTPDTTQKELRQCF